MLNPKQEYDFPVYDIQSAPGGQYEITYYIDYRSGISCIVPGELVGLDPFDEDTDRSKFNEDKFKDRAMSLGKEIIQEQVVMVEKQAETATDKLFERYFDD